MAKETEEGIFKSVRRTITNPRSWLLAIALGAGLSAADILNGNKPHSDDDICQPGDALEGVYRPQRLQVFSSCMRAKGTVVASLVNKDGDWSIGLLPDPSSIGLLIPGNARIGGLLMVEVIPKDQASLHLPRIGERIAVTGAYVEDLPNGWHEIHPAWRVYTLSNSPLPERFTNWLSKKISKLEDLPLRLRKI